MQCQNISEILVAALYGEADANDRLALEAHLAGCPACRDEQQALGAVRTQLARWQAPSFKPGRRPRAWGGPAWTWLAAAAVLVLALGGALRLSGLQIQSGPDGLTARFGAGRADTNALAALQAQHRLELAELRATVAARPAAAALDGQQYAALLAQVRQLIEASETRQHQDWQTLLAAASDRFEAERRYDRARTAASLSYLEGRTGQHMARTTQLVGYMLEASQPTER